MSLAFVIDVNIQRHWGHVVGLCIGTYAIIQGAVARKWTVRPRRSATEPVQQVTAIPLRARAREKGRWR